VVAANFLIDSESNLRSALNAFGRTQAGAAGTAETHRGEGSVEAVDLAHSSVTISHGPIASLKWPAMTMEFKVRDAALLRTLKPGQNTGFEFAAAAGGEYVIIRMQPAGASKPAAAPKAGPAPDAGGHKGH
jgi:Cu(I)/Ag(I) efflux system membrane fusion protein